MALSVELVVILLLIVLNGLFALSELALVSARRARLAVLERQGVPGAALARELSEEPQRFLPTVQVGITLVGILAGTFGGARLASRLAAVLQGLPYVGRFAESLSLVLTVAAITYLTLVIGELVPKQLAMRHPEHTAALVARPLAALARVSAPLVWVLGSSSGLLLRLFGVKGQGRTEVTEEELRALVAEGAQAGVLVTEERDMIERVLRLADKPVRALMTPRTEIDWIDRTDPSADIVATLKQSPHSRFIVCDTSVDNPVGVVQAKDLLDRMLDGAPLSIGAVLRKPMVIPDAVSALGALARLRADPMGLAIVMDEYGSFEGVVTAADVLEAIVGDLADEEQPTRLHGAVPDGTLSLDGMTPVDELKDRLALPALPAAGSYHTLGGLLLALLQRLPRVGDRIVFGGWRFEVTEMDGRRVERVQVEREPAAEG